MNVTDYLDRIGFSGPARTDLATLGALHRAHLDAIPFENLDVQLGHPVSQDIDAIFDKIARRRRGGWCFEMNGLFGWALHEIGFDVMRMAGGVMREAMGDAQLGNHLCLLVRLPEPWLADVGFGGSMRAPMALAPGARTDAPFGVELSQIGDDYWRFGETVGEGPPFTFDFRAAPADEALLAAKCAMLQVDPASPFVQNLVVQMRSGDAHTTLRGRVLTRMDASGSSKTVLRSAGELVATLRDTFGIDEPEAATLWRPICTRHEALFGA